MTTQSVHWSQKVDSELPEPLGHYWNSGLDCTWRDCPATWDSHRDNPAPCRLAGGPRKPEPLDPYAIPRWARNGRYKGIDDAAVLAMRKDWKSSRLTLVNWAKRNGYTFSEAKQIMERARVIQRRGEKRGK